MSSMANKYDLSVLIPARNEVFLSRTVEEILKNKRGKTEIIVVLDGAWADPPIEDHPDVTIIYNHEAVGQRAATNQACKISKAKYVMKIDAHSTVDEGFDVKLMADMKDNWTVVPALYNLHGFDWVCTKCKDRQYQGPSQKYKICDKCGGERIKEIIWKPRVNKRTTSWRFDKTLHFQYWGGYNDRQTDEIADTLSIQGSCFMLTREKYWELNICDEKFGSWGQQGVEVALKTWLSGGEVKVNKKTWYSHLFRTQGGDFSFPYPQSQKQIDHARQYSRELFMENKWPLAIHTFEWLLEKFYPIPDWHEIPKKGIIYYTDNQVNLKMGHMVRRQIQKAKLPIVSCSLKPMKFGHNIHLQMERGYLAYHKQILTALENSKSDIVFFCEHDVLYHPSHFEFTPPKKDIYYYNTNFWRVRVTDGHALHYDTEQVNLICAYRELLLQHYREKVKRIEKDGFSMRMGFEPGCNNRKEKIDTFKAERWQSKYPCLDLRHDTNLTRSRWTQDQFRNKKSIEGWKESNLGAIEGWDLSTGQLASK